MMRVSTECRIQVHHESPIRITPSLAHNEPPNVCANANAAMSAYAFDYRGRAYAQLMVLP